MTPRFSQFVDPIFVQVIDTLSALEDRGKPQPLPREVWTQLRDKIQSAERELRSTHGRAWELAKFALAAWIDETLKNTERWSQNEWLLKNFMEFELFKTLDSYQMFFVQAKEAASMTGGDDALETFYICGMLGFRGFYGVGGNFDSERVETTARQFDLPLTFADWVRETGNIVRERRRVAATAPESQVPERQIITARPFWSRGKLLWPWLIAAFLLAANVVAWWEWLQKRF